MRELTRRHADNASYIMSADRLARTARWIESFDGGIAKLRDIILNDSLGICADLERYMDVRAAIVSSSC